MIQSRWFGHASLDLSAQRNAVQLQRGIANEFSFALILTCRNGLLPNLALLSGADEEIGWRESQLAISFITLVYLGDKFSKSCPRLLRLFLTFWTPNSLINSDLEKNSRWRIFWFCKMLGIFSKIFPVKTEWKIQSIFHACLCFDSNTCRLFFFSFQIR